MSKISTYDVAPVPKLADKLIGTSVGGTPDDGTYNFTLQELLTLFLPNIPANNLQGVLDYGNTAIQDINLTGTIYTTDLDVSGTATILDSFLTGDTHISGGLFDVNDSIGTAGQVLISTGLDVEWYTIPTVIPDLQQVLTSGNTSTVDIILTSNLSALDVSSDTATFSTDITIDGTLTDGTASVGTAGKVLSSTGTGVQWVALPSYSATSPLFFNSGIFSIQVANGTQNGYLTSADWITFNGKQNAGNYITALTGEATATGPGSVAITLSNTAVIGKILTGLSITGGAIVAADTILQAFGKAQNQINGKQDTITLTTTGTSGAATLIGSTLNIPQYTDTYVGTVTSVAALTLGTVGTDLSSTVANSTTTPVITLNVPTASAANRGALSAADWSNFDSKQAAGNYITSLTGEATALGPGAAAVTLTNSAVIAKVLTGLNVTGGTVVAADNILAAFGKVQNQINGLIGGSIFQGVWNASTNTPALVSSVGTNGYYYIVNVAGSTNLDGITDWQVGDWAIFAGTSWQKVDNTDAVSSVNGFTGAVSLTTDNIPEGATNLYFTNTRARTAISLTTTGSSGASTYDNTTGVFNIPTYTDAFVGTVTSVGLSSATSGVTIGSTPITTSGTITIAIATATASQNGLLSSTDWTTFNNKQGTITLTTTGTSGAATFVANTLNIPNYTDAYVGTVTSVAALTLGTTGTDLSSTVANGTTTPVITLQVPTASATNRGALSSADWSTFNGKQGTITLTTTGTSGAATFSANTLNIPQYQASGTYVTSVTGTSPIVSSGGTTPAISIPVATTSVNGYLSSTDWTTFNNKAAALSGTTNYIPKFTSSSAIGNSAITDDGTTVTLVSRALSGTSASFSSTGFFGSDIFTYVNGGIFFNGLSSYTSGIFQQSGGTLALQTGGTPRLTIASTGAATFSSSVDMTGLSVSGATNKDISFQSASNIGYLTPYDDGLWLSINRKTTNGAFANASASAANIWLNGASGGSSIEFRTAAANNTAPTTRLTIASGGNVGIGTTSPSYLLHAKGSSLYNGTIFSDNSSATGSGSFQIGVNGTSVGALSAAGNILGNTDQNMAIYATTGLGLKVFVNATATPVFTIASTGAATFSSTVTATGLQINSATYAPVTINTTYGQVGMNFALNGTTFGGIGSGNNFSSDTGIAATDMGIGTNGTSTGKIIFATGAGYTTRLIIASGGNVLVGQTTDNGNKLQVNGTVKSNSSSAGFFFEDRASSAYYSGIYLNNSIIYFYNSGTSANIASISLSSGAYTALSDINKKKDFEQSKIGLNAILGLKPTLYRMKSDDDIQEKQLGFIAQEVKEFIPQAYSESGEANNKFIGLTEMPIIAALVNAIKEQQAQIEELKALII